MFERIDYRVIRIDGEYAYLQKLEDENAEEKWTKVIAKKIVCN